MIYTSSVFKGVCPLSKCHCHPVKIGLVVHLFEITIAGNIFNIAKRYEYGKKDNQMIFSAKHGFKSKSRNHICVWKCLYLQIVCLLKL